MIIPDKFLPVGYPKMFLYTLTDPVTGEICYIGLTEYPHRRIRQHCSQPGNYKGNARMTRWISSLSELGEKPIMTIVDAVDDLDIGGKNGKKRERELIREYWDSGHPLLNSERWMRSQDRFTNSKWYQQRMGAL